MTPELAKYDWNRVSPEVWTRTLKALDEYVESGFLGSRYGEQIELSSCLAMARAEAKVTLLEAIREDRDGQRKGREKLERELANMRAKLDDAEAMLPVAKCVTCTPADRTVLDAVDLVCELARTLGAMTTTPADRAVLDAARLVAGSHDNGECSPALNDDLAFRLDVLDGDAEALAELARRGEKP